MAGCASSNDFLVRNVNPTNGAPAYHTPPIDSVPQQSPIERRAEVIRSAANDELAGLIKWRVPDSVVSDVKVEQVNLATKITVTSTPKGFFPPGAYALQSIQRSEDRSGAVYMDIVSRTLRKVLDVAKSKGSGELAVTFAATYSAQADGLPVRNLRYRGEFGNVLLPSNITTLNGTPTEIRVVKGQVIGNSQLAALRAVSLASMLHGAMDPYPIGDTFVLTTTDARGLMERWVKVEVTITPAL